MNFSFVSILIFQSLLIIFLTNCTNTAKDEDPIPNKKPSPDTLKQQAQEMKVTTYENEIDPNYYYDFSNAVIKNAFADSITHIFSTKRRPDQFKIAVPKGKIKETMSYLLVINRNNDTLYFEEFKTWQLIYGYALNQMHSDEEVIEHIKDRVALNLDSSAFVFIDKTDLSIIRDKDPEETLKPGVFNFCKENQIPLYQFSLWTENHRFFGFDLEHGGVVLVASCC